MDAGGSRNELLLTKVEQVRRFLNPVSDPDTKPDLERLHDVVAGQGASGLGLRFLTPRQRQVRLNKSDQVNASPAVE